MPSFLSACRHGTYREIIEKVDLQPVSILDQGLRIAICRKDFRLIRILIAFGADFPSQDLVDQLIQGQ